MTYNAYLYRAQVIAPICYAAKSLSYKLLCTCNQKQSIVTIITSKCVEIHFFCIFSVVVYNLIDSVLIVFSCDFCVTNMCIGITDKTRSC